MNHERLAQLIRTHQDALDAGQEPLPVHEVILSIFRALDQGEITAGLAVYLLNYQAMHWADDPAQAAVYRQAAADLRQLQREEH
jgi:hypothetical protein